MLVHPPILTWVYHDPCNRWSRYIQSAYACACFVRVCHCRLGSILGSIWESFWEPSSPLYSFWAAQVANRAPKLGPFFKDVFQLIFRVRTGGGPGTSSAKGPEVGGVVKPHLAPETGGKPTREYIFWISVFRSS